VAEIIGDYVLGTHEAEIARLGLQHRVWRERMLAAWRRAGLRAGWHVVDVGAGPGYATWDLAELVGPSGEVLAAERSTRFVEAIRGESSRRCLRHVHVLEGDLMDMPAPHGLDMAWCRWVASFAESVPRLVRWIRDALRPGGTAVFHECTDYASWQFAHHRPLLKAFVTEVMASWRASGGEPDVAPLLVGTLCRDGFQVRSVRPHVFAANPDEMMWQWPAGFIATNAARLEGLGRVSEEWVEQVLSELKAAETDPSSLMVTPLVLEVIAERL
jgi:SAM-dependent methyltransferase